MKRIVLLLATLLAALWLASASYAESKPFITKWKGEAGKELKIPIFGKNYKLVIKKASDNTVLKTENVEGTRKFEEASRKVDTLSLRNEHLTEKVSRAAQLEARNISVEMQTKSGKKTTRVNKADVLKISFAISKNITANVGEKTVYVRVSNPRREVLYSKSSDTFVYENRSIVYSAKKNFEYSGQESHQTVYWTVTETLSKGSYRVDIFVDAHLIGSYDFVL